MLRNTEQITAANVNLTSIILVYGFALEALSSFLCPFCELFSKRVTSRSSRAPNQLNIIRFKSETGRNTLQYRGPVIWNFVNRLVKVPDNSYSFKQILRKHVKIIDNFSFGKGATVVANKKDDFIYF